MPSLFSRSQQSESLSPQPDEFGRVNSRSSTRHLAKKDGKDDKARQRTLSSTQNDRPTVTQFPDGAFLPLSLARPSEDSSQSYGYLAVDRHVVLGLEQLTRLVHILTHELTTRGGVATPFIFSSLALDISSTAIKRLIQAFLATCARPDDPDAARRWRDEAKFAGPYELGMALRWGLARAVRSVAGQDARGLVPWDHYVQFKDTEAGPSLFLSLFSVLSSRRQLSTTPHPTFPPFSTASIPTSSPSCTPCLLSSPA